MTAAQTSLGGIKGDQPNPRALKATRLGIRTHQEAVVYMHRDCHVCRSEGLTAQSRVLLRAAEREIIATLHRVETDLLSQDQAGLSEVAWERLGVEEGDSVYASHPSPWSHSAAFAAESTVIASMLPHFRQL